MRARGAAAVLVWAAATAAAPPPIDPAIAAWAFPARLAPSSPGSVDATTPRAVPGSRVRFTDAQLGDLQHAVDWFPERHPPMPPVVAAGRAPMVAACGYCHGPDGGGRPENASLAGLPEAYIAQQVAAFAAGTRTAAGPGYLPTTLMIGVAHAVSPADVRAAAHYYHRLRYSPTLRVVETAVVPRPEARGFLFAPGANAAPEPIGDRIVEAPVDFERFERRDPTVGIVAYVAPGSLARGAAVSERIGCPACHGVGMKLWGAGRSPSYIFRQLLAFRTGARHDAAAAPMTAVAARLDTADMIAVAAYWGSLRP
jgi:cytochrome c553